MFPDKEPASLTCCCFLIDILHAIRPSVQRLKPHRPAREVKINSKVPQKISTENPALREPSGFVHWFHIKHRRVDLFKFTRPQTQPRQLQKLRSEEHTSELQSRLQSRMPSSA